MKANDYFIKDREKDVAGMTVVCTLRIAPAGRRYKVSVYKTADSPTEIGDLVSCIGSFTNLKDANEAFNSEVKRLKSL